MVVIQSDFFVITISLALAFYTAIPVILIYFFPAPSWFIFIFNFNCGYMYSWGHSNAFGLHCCNFNFQKVSKTLYHCSFMSFIIHHFYFTNIVPGKSHFVTSVMLSNPRVCFHWVQIIPLLYFFVYHIWVKSLNICPPVSYFT